METNQGPEAEAEKDDVGSSNNAIDGNGNSEPDNQKRYAASWRVIGPARRSTRGKWTAEEDKLLQDAVQRYDGKCWKKIAKRKSHSLCHWTCVNCCPGGESAMTFSPECLPCRTDGQCSHRWQKVLNPELVKGPWTKEEDDLITDLVGKQGNKKWSEIAKHLPGRIGKQCRERWHNHLNPEINKNAWTREEELILIKVHSTYGNRWAEIAKFLRGRYHQEASFHKCRNPSELKWRKHFLSENSIKNHWNCSLKKKLEQKSSHSSFDHCEFTSPIICGAKTDAGNGEEMMVGQSPGVGFLVNQNMNNESILESCSLDLNFGHSKGRDSYLRPSMRENCSFTSRQASNPIEPPSLECREILENQDNGDNSTRSGDCRHIIPKLSNVSSSGFISKHVNAHLVCCKENYLINSPSSRSPCLYLPQHLNSSLGTDGYKNSDLDSSYASVVNFDIKQGSSLSKDCGDFGYGGQYSNSHSNIPRNGVRKQRTTSGMCKNLVDENYTGLCYEPLQQKDLKIFLSTGGFPSTDSYIRIPSNSTTLENPRVLEKRSYSSLESILRRAAMTFEEIPSIIRKQRLPTSTQASNTEHMGNLLTSVESFDSYNKRLPASHECSSAGGDNQLPQLMENFASPQKIQKLENFSAISSVGK